MAGTGWISTVVSWGAPASPTVRLVAVLLATISPADASQRQPAAPSTVEPPAAATGEPQFSKPVSSRLNQTGRTLSLPMPLKDGATKLGDVGVRIDVDDSIEVAVADLIDRTRGTLDDTTRARIEVFGRGAADRPGSRGYAPIAAIVAAGVPIRFDPGLQELQIAPSVDQRKTGDISIAPQFVPHLSATRARPAIWSGYLNVTAGVDYDWGHGDRIGGTDNRAGGRLELDSAVRAYDVVLENRALYDGAVDAYVCPARATCTYEHGAGLKRDTTRLVYDLPASHIRFQLGDTTAIGLPIQRSTETLGISIEKSAQKLAPGQSRVASARASLRIDRPSEVDVIVNGVTLQRLSLRPGTYNVRDLPLATGANTVDLAITDDTGARRVQSFTTFAGTDMLAPGAIEWSATAGVQSYLRDNQRRYEDSDGAIGTLFARYGVAEAITAEAHLQGDRRGAMGGAGVITETPWGVFTFGGAISYGEDASNGYGLGSGSIGSGSIRSGSVVSGYGGSGGRSLGYAADVSWDLVNYRGLLSTQSESVRLAAEYRSTEFFRPGQLASLVSGIYYPEYNYWLRLSGSYSVALDWSTSVTLSGRYQFGDDEIAKLTPYSVTGDRYGADISMSRPFSPMVTGSLLLGYSNESFLRNGLDGQRSNDADFRAAIRFHVRPDDRSTVSASYDSLDGMAGLSGYRSGGDGIGRWDASVDVHNFEATERTAASGSVGYTGNRADVRLSHHADVSAATGRSTRGSAQQQQRSSVRVGSGIAFADGVIGIGPPIRGEAFALVHPHESLAGKTIAAGSFETPRAFADSWGPGVVGDLPAYAPTSVAVDVADLPLGYSLGAGTFDVAAPYKAGYALTVGSGASVSVFGTLLNADGTPIELASGFATSSAGRADPIPVFTNAKGRFGAEGLSPGRWLIDVETDAGPVRYAIDIPKGANGLVRTGELRPIGNKR